MIGYLFILIIGIAAVGELKLRNPALRIAMLIVVCSICIFFSINIGHKFGDSFARNSTSTVVAEALNILERREMKGLEKNERIKLIRELSEQLPLALLDDRKATEFLNNLEHNGNARDEEP